MADEQRASEIEAQLAALLTGAGFPRMPARVLVALMLTPSASLTAAELVDRLGVSPAAVSGAVRYLETVRFARRVAVAGSRRERYELPENPWYTIGTGNERLYSEAGKLASTGARDLAGMPDVSARLQEMADFFAFLERRMPELFEEWKAQRVVAPEAQ